MGVETFDEAKMRWDRIVGLDSTVEGDDLIYRSPTGFPLLMADLSRIKGRFQSFFGHPIGLQRDWLKENGVGNTQMTVTSTTPDSGTGIDQPPQEAANVRYIPNLTPQNVSTIQIRCDLRHCLRKAAHESRMIYTLMELGLEETLDRLAEIGEKSNDIGLRRLLHGLCLIDDPTIPDVEHTEDHAGQ